MERATARRLLVLDDEFMIATGIADLLEEAGYEVAGPVRTLLEAKRIVSFERIDGAVLDVKLGHEDSLALAQEIRRKRIPILFVTGYSAEFLRGSLEHLPHLQKPFKIDDLLEAVAALFKTPCAPLAA